MLQRGPRPGNGPSLVPSSACFKGMPGGVRRPSEWFKEFTARVSPVVGGSGRGEDLMAAEENIIIIGKKPVIDYVLATIVLFNEGYDEVIIRGQGSNVSKAVDVYNALVHRLQDGVELVGVSIDSVERGRRLIPVIEIRVRRKIA